MPHKQELSVLTTPTAELPLLFGTHYEYRGNSTEYEWQVALGMQGKFRDISRQNLANDTILMFNLIGWRVK